MRKTDDTASVACAVLRRLWLLLAAAAVAAAFHAAPARAQVDDAPAGADAAEQRDPVTNRRVDNGEPVVLAFNQVQLKDIIDFIVETTGKTVVPSENVMSYRLTIVNDKPITREDALNQVFVALLAQRVGVVETEDMIRLEMVDQIGQRDCPVIGADESVRGRQDNGVIINKVFNLRYADCESVADVMEPLVPDWAQIEIETGTNSIVAMVSVGIAKKLELVIQSLDRPAPKETRTFLLEYADATTIAERIVELYGDTGTGTSGGNTRGRNPRDPRNIRGQGGASGESGGPGAGFAELRAVPDTRNNSITVVGDPDIVNDVAEQIKYHWDVRPAEDGDIIKTYTLQYRDVIVVRDILNNFSGEGTTAGGGGGARNIAAQSAGGGDSSSSTSRLASLYNIQADTSANQLIAIAKTSQSFELLDRIIETLDRAGAAEMPSYIELKHADAQDIAQEINILLAEKGIRIEQRGREEGLTEFERPTSAGQTTGTAGGTGGTGAQGGEAAVIQYPWQLARPREDQAPESPLIGQVRVMPVLRQNAVLVLGPPHYQNQVGELIEALDRPGRQVLITAIIAEVELEDTLALGLRWSRSDVFGPVTDNEFGGTANFEGTEEGLLDNLFDTAVLNVNVNVAAVIEALDRESNVRVLSKPRIFTADNEQANFFDGQDIQFVTDSITDIQTGNVNQGFEFRQVGITLSARPRITVNRDVDLLVSLELSSLAPNTTTSGGLIIDQRVTSTRVVVQDGQSIVISGILREQESDVKRKVPLLGDIPLLGALFTSTETEDRRSELIAFVTPIVIDNAEENERLNDPMLDRLQEMRRPLKEQKTTPKPESDPVWDEPMLPPRESLPGSTDDEEANGVADAANEKPQETDA